MVMLRILNHLSNSPLYGIGTFIAMKLTLVLLPVFIFEWCRQYRPGFVRLMLRAVIVAYLGTYLILFLTLNVAPLRDAHASAPPSHAQRIGGIE